MEQLGPLRARRYGARGTLAIVLHGGPGAPGSAAALARGLAGSFRVIEPWQRPSGSVPLTVLQHVQDLRELVVASRGAARTDCIAPVLIGESWGAMLALAYAAHYPHELGPLVLVSCGTFDTVARDSLQRTVSERMSPELRRRWQRLELELPDPAERLTQQHLLTSSLYSHAPCARPETELMEKLDVPAHQETWQDMLRLQAEGTYPAAFASIKTPVLMLHGAADPHPGSMIRSSLLPVLPQLEYRQWERCGHWPWLEPEIRDEFFAVLYEWLGRQSDSGLSQGRISGNR